MAIGAFPPPPPPSLSHFINTSIMRRERGRIHIEGLCVYVAAKATTAANYTLPATIRLSDFSQIFKFFNITQIKYVPFKNLHIKKNCGLSAALTYLRI